MNRFKIVARTFTSILPTSTLTTISGTRLLLPYHHVVSDDMLPHISQLYPYKNKKDFIKDLDWLLKRFTPIHPDDFSNIIFHQKPIPKKKFLLSFDDGLREVNDVIAPILASKGVPAIFFINPAFVDNKELFYRCKLSLILNKVESNEQLAKNISGSIGLSSFSYDELRDSLLEITYLDRFKADQLGKIAEINFEDFLQKQQPYLTSRQIKKLNAEGFTFGSHSIDHPHYKHLDVNEQCYQTAISSQYVLQLLGYNTRYFAFPHEDRQVTQSFFTEINKTGNNYLFFGTQNQRPEKYNLVFHRFNAERPKNSLRGTINTILLYNIFLRLLNKQSILRR